MKANSVKEVIKTCGSGNPSFDKALGGGFQLVSGVQTGFFVLHNGPRLDVSASWKVVINNTNDTPLTGWMHAICGTV